MITVTDVEILGSGDEVLRILLPAARAPIIFSITTTTTTTSDIPRLWLPNVDFSQSSETPRRSDGISEPQAPGESSVIVARRLVWSGQISLLLSNSHNHFIHNPVPGSPSLKSQPSVRSQAYENPKPRVDLMRVFIRDPPKSNQESVSPRSQPRFARVRTEVSRSRGRCDITYYYSPGLADQAPTEAIVPSPAPGRAGLIDESARGRWVVAASVLSLVLQGQGAASAPRATSGVDWTVVDYRKPPNTSTKSLPPTAHRLAFNLPTSTPAPARSPLSQPPPEDQTTSTATHWIIVDLPPTSSCTCIRQPGSPTLATMATLVQFGWHPAC
ncbi:hypothetical protein BGZ57DRAFT_924123 [Hyaloscypha finlandica]|nr:hypothetical protein BGZ57DRAFT_924123 [Hyaloscypha finlandica]